MESLFQVEHGVEQYYTGHAPALNDEGTFAVCACGNTANVVGLTESRGGAVVCRAEPRGGTVTAVLWLPLCAEVIVATQSMQLHHFQINGGLLSATTDSSGRGVAPPESARLLRSWKAHAAPVSLLAADSKSALVASAAADRSVLVWDIRQRHCTHQFGPLAGVPSALTFHPNPDRLTLYAGAGDGGFVEFDLVSKQSKLMEAHSSACSAISFAGDWTAVTGGREGVLCVWNMRTHSLQRSVACGERVEGLVVVPAVVSDSGENQSSGDIDPSASRASKRRKRKQGVAPAESQSPATDYAVVVAGGESGRLKLFELRTGKCVATQAKSAGLAPYISLSRGRRVTARSSRSGSGGGGGGVGGGVSLLGAMSDHSLNVVHVEFRPSKDKTPSLLHTARRLMGDNDEITDAKFVSVAGQPDSADAEGRENEPQTTSVLVSTNSPVARLYSFPGHACQLLVGHSEPILSLDVDGGRSLAVTGGKDASVRLWELPSQRERAHSATVVTPVAVCEGHGAAVTAVALIAEPAADDRSTVRLLSGSADRTLKVWRVRLPQAAAKGQSHAVEAKVTSAVATVAGHDKDINGVAVAPNGRLAASCSADKTIRLWRLDDLVGQGVLKGHRRGVWSVQFAPADRLLVSSSADGTLKLWNLATLACLRTFEGHDGSALKAVFVPPLGLQCASAGSDGLMKVWSVRTGECLGSFDDGHEAQAKVWALAAAPAVRRRGGPAAAGENDEPTDAPGLGDQQEMWTPAQLVTGGADGRVRVWRDCSAALAEAAAQRRRDQVLAVQQMENHVRANELDQALAVALRLRHPGRVLKVLLALGAGAPLTQALDALAPADLAACVRFAAAWNTRAAHAHLANAVLEAALRKLGWRNFAYAVLNDDEAAAAAAASSATAGSGTVGTVARDGRQDSLALLHRDAVSLLVAVQAYNQRHAARLERLLRQSYELDYLLSSSGQVQRIE